MRPEFHPPRGEHETPEELAASLQGVIDGTVVGWHVADFSDMKKTRGAPAISHEFTKLESGKQPIERLNLDKVAYWLISKLEARQMLDDLADDKQNVVDLDSYRRRHD